MLFVAIDTSVYRADARRTKPAFRALTRLIKGHEATLTIPYFVKREFVSGQQEAIGKAFKAIAEGASTIIRNTDGALIQYAKETLKRMETQKVVARSLLEAEFDAWLAEVHAKEYPLTLPQVESTVEDYFAGRLPFKCVKNRNDIPDSFIWHSVLDISHECGRVHFITHDEGLLATAKEQARVVAHRSLDDFIRSEECQSAIKKLGSVILEENIERAHSLLPQHEAQFAAKIKTRLPKVLTGTTVYDDSLPTPRNDATIYNVPSIDKVTISFDEASNYGENEIGIFFDAEVESTLEFTLSWNDYYRILPEERRLWHVDERDGHTLRIEDDRPLSLSGLLTLRLSDGRLGGITLDVADLERLITKAEMSVEVGDIEVE